MGLVWAIFFNLTSLFVPSYADDLGMSRKAINLVFTLRSICQLVISLVSGYIFSKVKMHNLMKLSSVVLVVFLYLHSTVQNQYQLYIYTIVAAVASMFLTIIPLSTILNNWFETKLGLVTGITFMGSGIGAMVLSPLVGNWIGSLGWRPTFVILAIIMGVLLIPIVFFILKTKPSEKGLAPYGRDGNAHGLEDINGSGLMLSEVVIRPKFWVLILGIGAASVGVTSLMLNLAPHLVEIDYSIEFSSAIVAAVSGALAIGKLLLGYLFDRTGIRTASFASCLAATIGLVSLYLVKDSSMFFVLVILGAGLGCAFFTVANQSIAKKLYGSKDYSNVFGILQAASSFGAIIAPIITGVLFDISNSYNSSLLVSAGLSAFSVVVFMILLPSMKKEPYKIAG